MRTPNHEAKKPRSQTAHSATGRPNTVGRMQRRKQQSALGGMFPNIHKERMIQNQRHKSRPSVQLTQKQRAASGGGVNIHASQATTKKLEYAKQLEFEENDKIEDLNSQFLSNHNMEFDESLPEIQSNGNNEHNGMAF